MTKQNYDPSQVTIEINGQVLQNVFATTESLKTPNIYSTQSLQINSLCEFARSLGYVPRDLDMISRGFVSLSGKTFYSTDFFIRMHNRNEWEVNKLFYNIAHVSKLVERVKLQRDKNSYGGVKAQSNKVNLTDKGKVYCAQFPRYDFLFLED